MAETADVEGLLQAGIAAATKGQREEALGLLRQVTERHPRLLEPWLWLGALAEDPQEAVSYLRRALEIEPRSLRAQKGLQWAQERLRSLPSNVEPPPSASFDLDPSRRSGEPHFGSPAFQELVETLSQEAGPQGEKPQVMPPSLSTRPEQTAPVEGPELASPTAASPQPSPAAPESSSAWGSILEDLKGLVAEGTVTEKPEGMTPREEPALPPPVAAAAVGSSPGGTSEGPAVAEVADLAAQTDDELLEAARQYLQQEDFAQARIFLKEFLQRNPKHPEALEQWGYASYKLGQRDDAIAAFTTLATAEPQWAEPQANLGFLLAQAGWLDEARVALEKALQRNAHLPEAVVALAEVLGRQGRWKEATKQWERARTLRPDLREVQSGLREAYVQRKDWKKALSTAQKVVSLRPSDAAAHLRLAQLYHLRKRWKEAQQAYQGVLQKEPALAEAHYGLACLFRDRRKRTEAVAAAQRALSLRPEYAEAASLLERLTGKKPARAASSPSPEQRKRRRPWGFLPFLRKRSSPREPSSQP